MSTKRKSISEPPSPNPKRRQSKGSKDAEGSVKPKRKVDLIDDDEDDIKPLAKSPKKSASRSKSPAKTLKSQSMDTSPSISSSSPIIKSRRTSTRALKATSSTDEEP